MATESINAIKCVFQFFGFSGGPLFELKEKLFANVVVSEDYLSHTRKLIHHCYTGDFIQNIVKWCHFLIIILFV
jgi:hypothetical protein